MLIIASPRSGGTAFCIDLAKKLNKPFLGELSALYLKGNGLENYKNWGHEIPDSQPDYSDEDFADMLSGQANGVILVNKTGYLYVDKADYILLRDPMNALMSLADSLSGGYPGMPVEAICHFLTSVFEDTYGLISYCLQEQESVIWFEDHYNCHTPTPIEHLPAQHEAIVRGYLTKLFKRSDIVEKVEMLRNIS